MDRRLSQETWRRLRQEARRAAAEEGRRRAEHWTARTLAAADPQLLTHLEEQLARLSRAWAVHERPLATRIPVIGPLLTALGTRLARFLLQHQVGLNAELASALQEVHRVQRLLAQEQIDRTDDLFARLEGRLLALEAQVRDLLAEVERLRKAGPERS